MTSRGYEAVIDRLKRTYIIALSAIAITFLVSQFLVQNHLKDQSGLSEVINRAGRQRMLSQNITKNILLSNDPENGSQVVDAKNSLNDNTLIWSSSHGALKNGEHNRSNIYSDQIDSLYQAMEPYYQNLHQSALESSTAQIEDFNTELNSILLAERNYLMFMDQIVNLYEQNGEEKVIQLMKIEMYLFFLGLTILFLEYLFLFRPGELAIKSYIQQLNVTNTELENTFTELTIAKDEKVKLNHELSSLNDALTYTVAYTTIRSDYTPIHVSKLLLKWFNISSYSEDETIYSLLAQQDGEKDHLRAFLESAQTRTKKTTINLSDGDRNVKAYEMEAIPMSSLSGNYHQLIILNDISDKKNIQAEIDKIKEAKFEAKMTEQKTRSMLIIEAQEKERKRIARDLHDGVGQSLTALKFQVQALSNLKDNSLKPQLSGLNEDIKKLIKEVRLVTFNLVPPELSDYGLHTALQKLVEKANKESDANISMDIVENEELRLEAHVESNLYRVAQEGLNNAIKYSKSDNIRLVYRHNSNLLSITIEDDGIGFELNKINPKINGSGMGLEFMQERMTYLDGRLFIDSQINKGTIITINLRTSS